MCSRGSDECAYLSEAVVIDEIRSVSVDQSVEGEAVLPAVTQRADVLSERTRRTETQKHIWLLFTVRSIWYVPVPPTGGDVSSQLQQLISGIVDIPGQHLSSCIHIHLTCSTIYMHTKCFHHNLVSVLREGSSSEVSSISFLYKCLFLRTDCHMSNRSSFGDWRFGDL